MKTIRQACVPRTATFDLARRDTVLDLSDLIGDRIDPAAFFAENHVTEGMRTLLTEGCRRLEGRSTQGVFKLTQAMGGGKTHNLLALGLLARHPALRAAVMGGFYTPDDIGQVRVVAFSGRESDIDVAYQLSRERGAGEDNPIERIIEDAVKTASHALVPNGLPAHLWRQLGPEERLYLKGLEVESHGDYRAGVYQEFARGFGVRDYRALVRTGKANETRLKTASELGNRELGDSTFGRSLVRHALYAVWRAVEGGGDPTDSLTWLRTELSGDYWPRREGLTAVLRYLASLGVAHWRTDADAARIVAGAVENDHV